MLETKRRAKESNTEPESQLYINALFAGCANRQTPANTFVMLALKATVVSAACFLCFQVAKKAIKCVTARITTSTGNT